MEDIEEVPEFTFPHHQYEEMISNFKVKYFYDLYL